MAFFFNNAIFYHLIKKMSSFHKLQGIQKIIISMKKVNA